MRSVSRIVLYAFPAIWAARLFAMATMPFVDTSEPRYAEIARLMAVSGDWITPWFSPGVPFWGKPPLAFWLQALCIRAFGLSEFSIRLASLPAILGMAGLCFVLARRMASREAGLWSSVIFSTMLLPAAAAGAVLTDPWLAFGVTLSMAAFYLARETPAWQWRYGFFLGLAIGLLAKGPLAVLLVAASLIPWLAWRRVFAMPRADAARGLPWTGGIVLVAALVLPWYIAAEVKTPGFLRYFILGEHFFRFVDPGWKGDLYGSAHVEPYGAIWAQWLLASLPWGALGLLALSWRWRERSTWRARLAMAARDSRWTYLLAWALATPLFFTLSANVIWTYVLPALPPAAVLLAAAMPTAPRPSVHKAVLACAALVPLAFLVVGTAAIVSPQRFKTEKGLVAMADAMKAPGERLYFVGSLPFSARFYSRGAAGKVEREQLCAVLPAAGKRVFLAVQVDEQDETLAMLPQGAAVAYAGKRHALIVTDGWREASPGCASQVSTTSPLNRARQVRSR
jgi:4-amino-4-deoxy-L-arabinose transferase-like glycosyltransferase